MGGGGLPTGAGGLVTSGGGIAQTASGAIIDSFEDGNAEDAYTVVSGSFTAVNDPAGAVHGDYYAESTGGIMYSTPGDGLENYFAEQTPVRAYTHCESSTTERAWVLFRVIDNFNYWAARVDYDNGAFGLVKRTDNSGGNVTVQENSTVAPAAGVDHAVDIDTASDDTITIGLVEADSGSELASISETDSTHSGAEGMGWIVDGQGANGVRLDHYHPR